MCNQHALERLEEAVRLERGGLLEKALAELDVIAETEEPDVVAAALRHQADIYRARCEWESALTLARRSGEVARAAGLTELEAEAVNAEAAVHLTRRSFEKAEPLLESMLEITRDPRIRGIALQNLGYSAAEQGRLEEASRRFLASHDCFHEAEYPRGMAMALVNSGRVALLEGDDVAAEELCSRADVAARRVGDLELSALACLNLGEALLRLGRADEAEVPASVALGYFTGVGNHWRRIECLRLFGDLHRRGGEREVALQCYARALELALENDVLEEMTRLQELIDELSVEDGARA